jgi:hypothetical protein
VNAGVWRTGHRGAVRGSEEDCRVRIEEAYSSKLHERRSPGSAAYDTPGWQALNGVLLRKIELRCIIEPLRARSTVNGRIEQAN